MKERIQKYTDQLISNLTKFDIIPVSQKEINYGLQILFSQNKEKIPVNIYYSPKKGISIIVGGSELSPLKKKIKNILGIESNPEIEKHTWKRWVGTDESGKGDFFGPLVVCGFLIKRSEIEDFEKLKIRDSKLMKEDEIIKTGRYLLEHYSSRIESIQLNPNKYNELYDKFTSQGKKLNELLAWMHARVIINLQKKHKIEGFVIDRFTADKVLKDSLKDMKEIRFHNIIKAESDFAVAAASIVARFKFIVALRNLTKRYNIEFPKGANNFVISTAKKFVERFGKNRLSSVSKIHFNTYSKI